MEKKKLLTRFPILLGVYIGPTATETLH